MGWRDRAVPVEQPATEGGGWRSRAVPVTTEGPSTPATPAPEKSFGDTLTEKVRAGLQGATFSYSDEMAASIEHPADALRAVFGKARHPGDEAPNEYIRARDAYRAVEEKAADDHPYTALAGALATPGMGSMKGVAGLAKFAGAGAVSALGSSHADLAGGKYGDAAEDAAIGLGTGLAFGGVAKGAGKSLGAAGRYIANLAPRAEQRAGDAAKAFIDKEIVAKQGRYRSGVQSASRDLEVLTRARDEIDGPVGRQIGEYLETPEAKSLFEGVASNKLKTAPERVSEMANLLAEYQGAVASREGDIAAKAAEDLGSPFRKGILPRLKTDLSRNVPIAVGSMIGGVPGMAAGAAVGAAFGARGTAWANALKSPRIQKAAGEILTNGVVALPGRTARALATAASESPTAFIAMHQFFKESDPTYPAKEMEEKIGEATREP